MGLLDLLSGYGGGGLLGGNDWLWQDPRRLEAMPNSMQGGTPAMSFADRMAPVFGAINGGQFQGDIRPGMGGLQDVSPQSMTAWRQGADSDITGNRTMQNAMAYADPQQPAYPQVDAQRQPPQGAPMGGGGLFGGGPPQPQGGLFGGGLPAPQASNPLMAGLQSFGGSRSPIEAITNLIGGLATGQRQDKTGIAVEQQRQAQMGAYQAVRQAGGSEAQALAAASNPEVFKALVPDLFGAPKVVQTGEGLLGDKQFMLQQGSKFSPVPGQGGGGLSPNIGGLAEGVKNIDSSLIGDDYLKQFSPEVQAAVKAYMAGETQPTGNPRKGFIQAVKMIAQKVGADKGEPVTDAKFTEMQNFRRELGKTSPQSVGGQRNLALTSMSHLLEAGKTAEKLQNYNFDNLPALLSQGVNKAANVFGSPERSGLIKALAGNAEKYSQEVTKFYAGGPGTGGERERTSALFNPSNTPIETALVLEKERDLLAGKLDALEAQKQEALGKSGANIEMVTKEGRKNLQELDELIARLRGKGSKSTAHAPAASSNDGWTDVGGGVRIRQR